MRDYAKITTKEDRKQVKLAGENLQNAMKFFNQMMMEIKIMKMEHSEWIKKTCFLSVIMLRLYCSKKTHTSAG